MKKFKLKENICVHDRAWLSYVPDEGDEEMESLDSVSWTVFSSQWTAPDVHANLKLSDGDSQATSLFYTFSNPTQKSSAMASIADLISELEKMYAAMEGVEFEVVEDEKAEEEKGE